VNVLHDYRERLGVSGNTWQFVTGKQDDIYNIGEKFYMVTAQEDSTAVAEGGFLHSGAFVLVDKNRHIRGVYDGTVEDEVSQLMKDIELLLSKEN
jgi:protein SCO1/2